jgi:hypothetical protein
MATLRRVVGAVFATLLNTAVALAQPTSSNARLDVEAFDVEQVVQLSPGTRLNFSLYGTAGAIATLRIDGAARDLQLQEVRPGAYEGSYVVDAQDRIPPGGHVTATLRRGDRVMRVVLEEPLLLGSAAAPPVAAQPPPQPPVARSAPPQAQPPDALETPVCSNCAVVESIRPLANVTSLSREIMDLARYVATFNSRWIDQKTRTAYDVVLRLPNGTRVIRTYENTPPFRVGETIALGVNLGGARAERPAPPWRPAAAQ